LHHMHLLHLHHVLHLLLPHGLLLLLLLWRHIHETVGHARHHSTGNVGQEMLLERVALVLVARVACHLQAEFRLVATKELQEASKRERE